MEAKKRRGCNYTAGEKQLLLDLIKKHQHIIENKVIDGPMILKKRKAWNTVCQQYNAVAVSGLRKWQQLRHLFENLKQKSKKDITKLNYEKYLENSKELQKKASIDKKEICCTCGGAYKKTLTEQDAEFSAVLAPKIEPLPTVYDDAALCFDDQHTTISNTTVTRYSKPSTVTSNTPGQTQTKRENEETESNVKLQYFNAKLRNAKIERACLINKNKMDIAKYKIEMEILKIKLNKLKYVRKRKY